MNAALPPGSAVRVEYQGDSETGSPMGGEEPDGWKVSVSGS